MSVDPLEVSRKFADDLGLSVLVASDPGLAVIGRWNLENPDVEGLSLHAVYIVDTDGTIFYRKVARRRPRAGELLDAIDYHRGR